MSQRRKAHNPLQDEQGDWSFSRLALLAVLLFTARIIWADVFEAVAVPTEAYSLLGGTIIALAAWAGGRAGLRYLGPAVQGMVSGIAASKPNQPHQWRAGSPDEGVI